jgi:predicted transcriptional regulator of viral defense system
MSDLLDRAIARIAEEHHGIFGCHHLALLGVTPEQRRHRLATGRWVRLYDSAYRIGGAPLRWHGAVLAACWAGGTRAFASHRTALALHRLPGGARDHIEITCPHGRRARHDGLVVHESRVHDNDQLTLVAAIPCTTVERTLFDLAANKKRKTLHLAIDAALRMGTTDVVALRREAERMAKRGRAGSVTFRRAIEARTPGEVLPESAPERLLAQALVDQGLPMPTLQYVVRDAAGDHVARVDLAYPSDKILIEYESFEHHTGAVALVRDSARRNALVALGYVVLSATAADLRNRASRLADSIRAIRAAKAS